MLAAGIVGLPNAGKSTLFNALTRAHQAPVAAYPFCTIEPNVGVIEVPDDRLAPLAALYGSARAVPAAFEFIDIAGLVRGAHRGEGLGNRFLGHLREVDAVVEMVRCFEHADIAHVEGQVDPVRDVETLATELALADLETVSRRREKVERQVQVGDRSARAELPALEALAAGLDAGRPVRALELDEPARTLAAELFLLTAKPRLVVANLAEDQLGTAAPAATRLREHLAGSGVPVVELSAELEAQLVDLDPPDAAEYLAALGVEQAGVGELIRATYRLLGLVTFYTGNEKELRARPIAAGTTAVEAAEAVHTDIARGFIGAEVIAADRLLAEGSLQHARERGHLRLEGRDYVVQDADAVQFRFNV
jgi:hypothetical protein